MDARRSTWYTTGGMQPVSWPAWSEGVVIYAGSLLAWGLGLYVVTRGGLRPIPLLAESSPRWDSARIT